MFGMFRKRATDGRPTADARLAELQGQVDALHRVQAVIEFALDGTILAANANFLSAVGYRLEEVQGRHHRLFVAAEFADSPAYLEFWDRLGRGEYDAGRYRRLAKGGREIWIQASYNPVFDASGRAVKVVKFATDITAQMLEAADHAGQLAAISKAQAVIEFGLDGRILDANANFLAALGYALDEIRGQHHSMFVEPSQRLGEDYRQFWLALGRGEFSSGRYKRLAKGGREVWIQATYNPIFDMAGRPFKVVKYASDITAQVRDEQALQAAVAQTRDVVSAAQAGDLTGRVSMEGKHGAVADLCQGVNALVESTGGVIARVKAAADLVRDASREISAGNRDLAERTEQQAASLEETAASMEELSVTVRHNTDNAQRASEVARQTCLVATSGGQAVSGVVGVMDLINQASRRITDIIGVIDGIAFQTNILALNAAVEAARAGEQGRGFAVVATEVRTLAQRTAGAAKEIKSLIDDSSQKVQTGTALVHTAGTTMEEIVGSVQRVSELIAQIATASAEQSAGVAQITQSVGAMDESTQQNAAMVEEVSASARNLEDQAGELAGIVADFRVEAGERGAGTVVAAATRFRKLG